MNSLFGCAAFLWASVRSCRPLARMRCHCPAVAIFVEDTMHIQRTAILYWIIAMAAIGGISFWYMTAVSVLARELGIPLFDAAMSFEGFMYGLRAMTLVVLVALWIKFLVLVKRRN